MTEISTSLTDGVLTLTLARAGKRNAITRAMYGAMTEALAAAEADEQVRAVLLRADGEHFCAGNDIADFVAAAGEGGEMENSAVFGFLRALTQATKPVVAAVRGRAVGIGTTMLLHCDLVVVGEDARLSVPFVDLALVPEAASSRLLVQRIGHVRAYEMFALGRVVDGPTALDWGLANRCVATEQVDQTARDLAVALAGKAPGALAHTKRLMRDPDALWAHMLEEGRAFQAQMRSPEAMAAFAGFLGRSSR